MGPSGCGKTTLLNVLARRTASSGAKVLGETYVNNSQVDSKSFQQMTSYVEQEDALIGSLTVQETLKFAADLSLPRYVALRLWPMPNLSSTAGDTDVYSFGQTALYQSSNASAGFKPYWKHSVSKNKQTHWLALPFERELAVVRSGELVLLASSLLVPRSCSWTSQPVVWTPPLVLK